MNIKIVPPEMTTSELADMLGGEVIDFTDLNAAGVALVEYGSDGCMKWERVVPPLWWDEAQLFVVADRHLEDGTREHMVRGHVEPGTVIRNANIVGELDAPEAEYSSRLSHLSAGVASGLRRNRAVLNIDMDSGSTLTNPFRGSSHGYDES